LSTNSRPGPRFEPTHAMTSVQAAPSPVSRFRVMMYGVEAEPFPVTEIPRPPATAQLQTVDPHPQRLIGFDLHFRR
jgi:hypothetical protein